VTEVTTFDRLLAGAELGHARDRIDGAFIRRLIWAASDCET
jgi:hypothetical protein